VTSAVAATASTAIIQVRFSMRASLGWSGWWGCQRLPYPRWVTGP
jgi:hypothetical protein